MAKRTVEELAGVLGHKRSEIVAVDHAGDGDVVTGKDGQRLIVFDDNSVAWYGYGDKPPNYALPVFNPATKEVAQLEPPAKAKTATK